MKRFGGYFRAVMFSIVAAFAIDFFVNLDEYRDGWNAGFYGDGRSTSGSTVAVSESHTAGQLAKAMAHAIVIIIRARL